MNSEETLEIQALASQGMSIRAIAKKLGRDRNTIRHALNRPPQRPAPLKLEPFKLKIRELLSQGLTGPRILREIRALGYSGGRTLLGDLLRQTRGQVRQTRKVFRRFETDPAHEAQCDWSPYRIWIAAEETLVQCFSLVMAYSRYLWIGFYRNQRLPSLLDAHVKAFQSMHGCPRMILYDNQTQVTLGRQQGKPLWNPSFLEFAKHYGFEPKVCRPRDPNRRGKGERPFAWIYTDLVKGSQFESWEDLNQKAQTWLASVANVRVHSTTRRRVDEMFSEEQPLLIQLPSLPYPTDRREVRKVQSDGYVALDGSYYPVPPRLVGQHVTLRVYPDHIEVLDAAGQVAVSHRIPTRPTRLPTDADSLRTPPSPIPRMALEAAFLAQFPMAALFLDGLHARMKSLLPIHLNQVQRLVEVYGQAPVCAAIQRAQQYRNFSALALKRILQRTHPNVVAAPPIWFGVNPHALEALEEVEPTSPKDYSLDSLPPSPEVPHGT